MTKFTCWYCNKVGNYEDMINACSCSKILTKKDIWVKFKITDEMIGTCTCSLVCCKECDEKGEW